MRTFYDLEFIEDADGIEWISYGAHREDGAELYLVNRALGFTSSALYQRVVRHSWLMRNVVPHLPLVGEVSTTGFQLDMTRTEVVQTDDAASRIYEFVVHGGDPELWAWYGAYDHVAVCRMFGRMIDLPEGYPMFTNDIRTLAMLAGPDVHRRAPEQNMGSVHNALADARHNRALFEFYGPHVDPRRLAIDPPGFNPVGFRREREGRWVDPVIEP